MAIPYRLFNRFYERVLHGQDAGNSFDSSGLWTTENLATSEIGHTYGYDRWDSIFKGYWADGWIEPMPAGLDQVMKIRVDGQILPPFYNVQPITDINFKIGTILLSDPKIWDPATVTGRHYNGVDEWENYPLQLGLGGDYWVAVATMPAIQTFWIPAWLGNQCGNPSGPYLWRTGCAVYLGSSVPSTAFWHGVDGVRLIFHPSQVKVSFWNSIINTVSRLSWTTAGGVPLVLTGLGFLNDTTEIEEGGGSKPGGWGDYNWYLHLIGIEGQGTYTLSSSSDFTNDSNTQITIPSLPAMAAGHYYMKLDKVNHGTTQDVYSYAGDFRCETDGRVYNGNRFIFTVTGGTIQPPGEDIYVTSEWKWKSRTGEIFKYWAPIDTRTPSIFYDGRILAVGSFNRAPSDIGGLAEISDLSIEISNADQEISKLLAEYDCLNQEVSFWWGFRDQPYTTRSYLNTFIVADYERPDSTWKATLRDINARYF